ncbi:50S ribosomal protein L11 methyltransferase [uncultured Akkermansia sp.]|uniref:50S ribosomal protein L11 methyltransferase n=1 Tax=uncultured Akkermansia sp. TaxID=512294 RepID=UPI002630D426|nr:50S ribosomal protein L11 methyltransferase [uncultured Akkermansia sp.]
MTWSWNKLSAAKWEDAWSERIAGNPNAVITKIKGGKTVRITVYCDDEEDALALKKYFGGTVREVRTQDWVAAQKREKRPPLKIRDALVITEQSSPENQAALRKQFPSRSILSVPAEMAFGTGDHATTSTCLRFICDVAKSRRKTSWTMTDIGCGTAVLAMAALKLGAEHATAFDFEPMAIEVPGTTWSATPSRRNSWTYLWETSSNGSLRNPSRGILSSPTCFQLSCKELFRISSPP